MTCCMGLIQLGIFFDLRCPRDELLPLQQRIQDRLGPTRLGYWGLPQMIADAWRWSNGPGYAE